MRAFLRRLTIRSVLSDAEQDLILNLPFRVKQVRPNEDFVALSERVDHACYVVDGLVGRFDQNRRGDRQITALHIGGDMPDLISVVQPTATSALQSLSVATILQVPHQALRAAAGKYPAIAEAFWRDSAADAMILAQWVMNVGRRDAQCRIAHLLCEMACRYAAEPEGELVTFELPMTQLQMADATGLTPVHVNRTLRGLAGIGTTFRNRKVRIEKWSKLQDVGDFDRGYLQDRLNPEERIMIFH